MTHPHHAKKKQPAKVLIITVSDTRDVTTDKSGDLIAKYLEENDHKVVDRKIIQDEEKLIRETVLEGSERVDIDVILTTGGTGISKRDVTIETVEKLFDKEITGFGELFRMLSYTEDIGSAAIMSRATAGLINETAVFSMPGSSGAVKLAMEKLILPELGHILFELAKDQGK